MSISTVHAVNNTVNTANTDEVKVRQNAEENASIAAFLWILDTLQETAAAQREAEQNAQAAPSAAPSMVPSAAPSQVPSAAPGMVPSAAPTAAP